MRNFVNKSLQRVTRGTIWSDGYFVSTVGLNEEQIRKYIERQGEVDSAGTIIEL